MKTTVRSLPPTDPLQGSHLYLQIARQLAQGIDNGSYRVDEALPSERLLAESLGVSRITARKAIDMLVEQGLVVRRHGSGNFIVPRLEQVLSRLSSFSEELRQRGYAPSSRWLSREIRSATETQRRSLGLAPSALVARLERLRLADGVPMAYELGVLPHAVLPQPQALEDSLYSYLEQSGQVPVRAVQHIRAMHADARVAELLALPPGAALLWVSRTSYAASGEPLEFTQSYCRSDYYDFVVEMKRNP